MTAPEIDGDTDADALREAHAAGAVLPVPLELDDGTLVNAHELLAVVGPRYADLESTLLREGGALYEPVDGDPRLVYGRDRADINARLADRGVPVRLWSFDDSVDVIDVQLRLARQGVHLNRILRGSRKMTGVGSAGGPVPAAEPGVLAGPDVGPPPGSAGTLAILDSGLPTPWREWFPELGVAVEPFSTANQTDDVTGNPEEDNSVGHGLFVSGIVRQVEPTVATVVRRVLRWRLGDDAFLAAELASVQEPVINLSLLAWTSVGEGPPVGMRAAIGKLLADGKVVVAAAGNGITVGDTAVGFDGGVVLAVWPAMLKGVISVGAMDSRREPPVATTFSNYGSTVDVWAPGIGVRSTFLKDTDLAMADGSTEHFDGWATWHGTSFAAPMVAARIARLVADDNGRRTPAEVAHEFLAGLQTSTFPGAGKVFDPHVPGLIVTT
jgi:hypothetical protein